MLHSGLVSVTFRQLGPEAIIEMVAQAGLRAIEWGGDVHVPHGDLARACEVRALTADAGLEVAAYGSYYRVGESGAEALSFERVLDTAQALGAPLIRVWAGKQGSAVADAAYRERIVVDLRRIVELAAAADIVVATEYHDGTLTDTAESARELLTAAAHPNLRTLWQPRHVGPPGDEATVYANLEDLETLLPWLANLHVFHWEIAGSGREARPVAEGEMAWQRYLKLAASPPGDRYAMLEFVRGETPEAFEHDARTLSTWLETGASLDSRAR